MTSRLWKSAGLCSAALVAMLGWSGGVGAATSNNTFGPSYSFVNGSPQIDIPLTVEKSIQGSASLTITVLGDLNAAPTETLHVLIDGVEVAAFNQNQCGGVVQPETRTITVDAATLAPLITDGQVVLTFKGGPDINSFCSPSGVFTNNNFSLAVQGTFTFATAPATTSNSPLQTVQTISNFMGQRNNQILSNGPDDGRQIDRLNDFNTGGNGGGTGSQLTDNGEGPRGQMPTRLGNADDGDRGVVRASKGDRLADVMPHTMPFIRGADGNPFPRQEAALGPDTGASGPISVGGPVRLFGMFEDATRFSFSTSLRDVARYAAQLDANRGGDDQMGLGLKGRSTGARSWANPFDVWVDVRYAGFRDARNGSDLGGHFGMASVGADYVLNSRLLVGTMIQFDQAHQRSDARTSEVSGHGWMVGPYATVRLSNNLFWQSRLAWGQSHNDVSPTMTYTDSFNSSRWLASTTLAGRWTHGPWIFKPALTVGYMEDVAKSYVDTNGTFIPTVYTSLGQLKAGPDVTYRYRASSDLWLEPHAGVQLIWNFASGANAEGVAGLSGEQAGPAGVRGRTDIGLRALATNGLVVDVSGAYDGLGFTGYSAFIGRAAVHVPFN